MGGPNASFQTQFGFDPYPHRSFVSLCTIELDILFPLTLYHEKGLSNFRISNLTNTLGCGPWCGLSEHRGSRLNPILRPICLLFSVPCDNFTKQVIFRGIIVFRGVGSLIFGFCHRIR